jgi:hypothetical protein
VVLIQSVENIQAWLFTAGKKIPDTLHDDLRTFLATPFASVTMFGVDSNREHLSLIIGTDRQLSSLTASFLRAIYKIHNYVE